MSEYQYYEFQAIDKPLSDGDRQALRAMSSRAHITSNSFVNKYYWGDFSGKPEVLMERWFDLHLYRANWGTRRLMIRVPEHAGGQHRVSELLREIHRVESWIVNENRIIDISRDGLELGDDILYGEDEKSRGWLAAIAPIRADLILGDLRLFYLLWLLSCESEEEGEQVYEDTPEPLAGLGPLTEAHRAFSEFFQIDPFLLEAAAERPYATPVSAVTENTLRLFLSQTPKREMADALFRVLVADPSVVVDLQAKLREWLIARAASSPEAPRTIAELRVRAKEIQLHSEASAGKEEIEGLRLEASEQARRARIDKIARRGKRAWADVETEIERGSQYGYVSAANLLHDLHSIAKEEDTMEEFQRRLQDIRTRHGQEHGFLSRISNL